MKKIKMLLAVMLIMSGIGIVSGSDKCIGTARCSEWTTAEPNNWIEVRNDGSLYPYEDQWIYLYSSANIAYGDNAFSSGTTTPEGWTYVYKNTKLEFHPSKGDSIWIWVTGRVTYQSFVQRTAQGDDMQPNEVLHSNDYIRSPSGQFTLRYQEDGNLVLIDGDNRALWDSETFGKPEGTVVIQDDGNLVIYHSGNPIWDSETFGNPGAWLFVQDDGNVIIDNTDGKAIWDTETWQPDDKIWHPRYAW